MAAVSQVDWPTPAPAPGWRVLAVITGMVILSDVTLFHSRGYLGPAVFFPLATILLLAGHGTFRMTMPVLGSGFLLLKTPPSRIGRRGKGGVLGRCID